MTAFVFGIIGTPVSCEDPKVKSAFLELFFSVDGCEVVSSTSLP
ncbi:hypothetical protein [Desulfosarcina widdelii]|nr:hypothetical protein [Desulfosarcina widdelii]